ncbi:hypothetical protein H0H87_006046 [Tephrocybe sp. NHM501043]|nr:hypothetical protein H0H87_006046 [Tephrocybe sp. NHM501043]
MKRKSEGQAGQTKKNTSNKRQKSASTSKSGQFLEPDVPLWPEYFQDLFKAINTVLGFVSSRKQLATTFSVVKSSVESLLKQAILPDLIKFSYIPRNELRITEDSLKGHRERSPDYSTFGAASTSATKLENEDDHVLVLEFIDNAKGKKIKSNSIVTVPALQPAAVRKLVEKRNKRFEQAVNDLLISKPGIEDPVTALQAAARAHVPVNPSDDASTTKLTDKKFASVPDPSSRPSIDEIINEIREQAWSKDRITHRRTTEAKGAQTTTIEPPLSPSISQSLWDSRKITSLYSHQVAAIQALAQRRHVIVSTSTASGKSVPVLRFLEKDPSATAVFALAQDQKLAMEQLISTCTDLQHLRVSSYA